MSFSVHLYYTGKNNAAQKFAQEMESSGTAANIRQADGNLGYSYYQPLDDPETVLLIDSWENQEALDRHHASPAMETIARLRDKYDLHMRVERYVSAEDSNEQNDDRFIRK